MADPITIHGGINIGTDGNDDLGTLEWQRNVEEQRDETTIYTEGIRALSGDDNLTNNGNFSNVSLDGGAGNDRIINSNTGGENVLFLGGDGNDYIENGNYDTRRNNATIDGGAGSDTVSNYGDNASITLGGGDDSLYNVGDKSTIAGGDNADSISSYGDDSSIDGGNGNDWLEAWGANVTVNGGTGNDTLRGGGDNEQDRASNVLFEDTIGNNRFNLYYTTNGTINAGAGDDTVYNDSSYNKKILINVGAGNNSVYTWYDSDATILAQGGNDSLYLQDSSNMSIDAGDGANYINISNVNDSTASGYTINAGAGDDSINNGGDNAIINAGNGNNSIISGGYRGGNNVTITSGSGNDFINNYYSTEYASTARQENAGINAGAGNDTVMNSGNKTTIDGGDGNDEISSYDGTNVSINGGAGSDTIFLANGTVDGGAGDDSLSVGENVLIRYTEGAGSDTIRGFNANSTLSIGGGNYSSVTSGDDVILSVGSDKITLEGAATLDVLNIKGTYDSTGGGDSTDSLNAAAASVAGMILYRTEAGYPVMAGVAFSPEVYFGDEPTNYTSKETWSITSNDGLKLNGVHYTPENSNDKWVVIVHGYGNNHKHMYAYAEQYLANGYNVLMVDQRAAGDSEGSWLTMGAAESQDLALWTQEIARQNSNAKITLFGVSMGAATAMLAASRSDTKNVTSLVEDCGYTNMMDVVYLLQANNPVLNSLLPTEMLPVLDTVASMFTGYNLSDAAPLDSISGAKIPTLFINGSDDTVVPVSMLSSLYDASGATVKEKFIVDGAPHALSASVDAVGYSNAVFRFVAEADGEGWLTENVTDKISLRGTKYNDTITTSGNNVSINTGAGNDTIVNSGANVRFVYAAGDGNDVITGFDGNDTLNITGGKYSSVTSGNDLVLSVGNGKITLIDAASLSNANIIGTYDGTQPDTTPSSNVIENSVNRTLVTGTAYNDTITNTGKRVTIQGFAGDDLISNSGSNVLIYGDEGKDSITASGENSTINGGAGSNFVSITGSKGLYVVFSGNTTVQGFNTGFGNGSDTVYIPGAPAGVDFKSGVLTFYNDNENAALVMQDITSTAKVNLYHESRDVLNKGVFIADNDWYSVKSGDLSVKNGEEVYFVGPSATANHGVDFSGISQALNLTLDTAYVDSEDYVPTSIWINGVYSIRGGAGLTTITGSDQSDTIIAGTGTTTINARGGNDRISLASASALVKYASGDGNDVITGFNANSTLNITGGKYSSVTSGDDVILTVGKGKITLDGAANLSNANIVGTYDNSGSSSNNNSNNSNSNNGNNNSNGTGGDTSSGGSTGGNNATYTLPSSAGNSGAATTSSGNSSTQNNSSTANIYTGGNQVISNYQSGEKIILGTEYTGSFYDSAGNFCVNSPTGTLVVQNAVDKVVDLSDAAGNSIIKAYTASTAGVIDGRGLTGFEIINGSAGADSIFAGDGGSQLWGGADVATDILVGGNGADIFIGGQTQGADVFLNASSADMVHLNDATLSDIVATAEIGGNVLVGFNTGNIISVQSTEVLSAKFALANGSAYRYNHATKSWQSE